MRESGESRRSATTYISRSQVVVLCSSDESSSTDFRWPGDSRRRRELELDRLGSTDSEIWR